VGCCGKTEAREFLLTLNRTMIEAGMSRAEMMRLKIKLFDLEQEISRPDMQSSFSDNENKFSKSLSYDAEWIACDRLSRAVGA
jgi:hypothetical protein